MNSALFILKVMGTKVWLGADMRMIQNIVPVNRSLACSQHQDPSLVMSLKLSLKPALSVILISSVIFVKCLFAERYITN